MTGRGQEDAGSAPSRERLDWILAQHATLYEEFDYAPVFIDYVQKGLPPFLRGYDAARDRLWIEEQDGRRLGAIAVMHADPGVARLRWFFVLPAARGQRLGRRMLARALAFAHDAGYEQVELWTCSDLVAARRLYEEAGFTLSETAPCPWKPSVVQQKFVLNLVPGRS